MQLEDALGTFYLRSVLREIGQTTELYRVPPMEILFDGVTNRVVPLEIKMTLMGLAFPRPGAYELLVFANQVSLHEANGRAPIPFPTVRITVLGPDGSEGGVV